jgi:hypothetical protein
VESADEGSHNDPVSNVLRLCERSQTHSRLDDCGSCFVVARAVKKYREFVFVTFRSIVTVVNRFECSGKPKIPQIVLYQSGVGSQAGFDHAQSGVLGVGESVNSQSSSELGIHWGG